MLLLGSAKQFQQCKQCKVRCYLYLWWHFFVIVIGFWDQVAKIEAFSKDRKITKLEGEQIIGIVAL